MSKIPASIKSRVDELIAGGAVDNETVKKTKVNDPARRIEFEVGDALQTDFYPQFKTKHWDNECNFSARLVTQPGAVVEHEGKLAYDDGEKIARFYEKDTGDEDGGFEFDVVFNQKPTSNVLRWTLQHKGLESFYQPALTQEEINQGIYRPDNAEGSYAFYHATKRHNRIGGKHYRAGKAFHIYRPYAEDANGSREWCELNVTGNLMTVTIPQDFLDNAAYPVQVDPTFGYTTAGSGYQTMAGAPNDLYASQESLSEAGTVTQLSFYKKTDGSTFTNINAAMAIYNSAGTTLIAETGTTLLQDNVNQWYDFDLTAPEELSATDYYLAAWSDDWGGATQFYGLAQDAATHNTLFINGQSGWQTWPTSISGGTSSTADRPSIYATYSDIIFDAKSTGETFSTPLTVAHTCGASADFLVACIITRTDVDVTAVTYNSTSLTKGPDVTGATDGQHAEIWYLANPDTGSSYNLSVTSASNANVIAHVSSWSGISSTGQPDTSNTAQANSSSISTSVTPTSSDVLVIDTFLSEDRDIYSTIGANQTVLYATDEGQFNVGSSYKFATNSSTSMAWTFARADTYAHAVAVFAAASGASPSITLSKGTFTLTGNAVTFAKTHVTTLTKGTFTLTGNDVTLSKRYAVTLETGSFTLTGNSITTLYNQAITLETGSFILNGNALGLNEQKTIALSPGSFTLTGNDVTLTKTRKANLTAGSFTLTGNDVTLAKTVGVTLETGTFTLTGNDVTLSSGAAITLEVGSFTLTGNDVTFAKTYVVTLETGTFTLTGNPVTLATTPTIELAVGTFTLTGNALTLARRYPVTLETGTFTLTGNDVTFSESLIFSLGSGSYTLTGNDVTLAKTSAITLETGTFTFTGNNVSLTQPGVNAITLETGVFTLTGYDLTTTRSSKVYISLDTGEVFYKVTGNYIIKL